METIEPKIDKKGVNELSFDQKVKMGKDIERMMAVEKEKLSHES